ncbi:LPD29 domain-containing protein [Paenibacillus prosopidis]|uniref:Large polyvalent protein associated domain-containing protein n=1 Tax=Paenibacillus prosopidis TaxID=630520 RepID=A0A368VL74_9BACL|nr:LPD29 domain-containing protein [Paenibacillus prosopidis]RCW41619.1 hypothetical protein DFP97_12255 [Paenibacillus prosopidis]
MTMEKISIPGKEAKKHILAALKLVFPGFKFSLTSEYDSVLVSWTDGPLTPDVQKVLNRFESYTRVLWKTDYTEPTGYEWKGQLYLGPRYLSTVRRLSDERKAELIEYMAAGGADYYDAKVFERVDAEREMIREGNLDGFEPKNLPDLMRDAAPEIDKREKKGIQSGDTPAAVMVEPKQTAQVINFPNRGSAVREHEFYKTLDPEQRLKLRTLQMLFKVDADRLIESGLSVDEAFSLAATHVLK